MPKTVIFTSRIELDANINLNAFIAFAREQLTAFGEDLEFDKPKWDVTEYTSVPGDVDRKTIIYFRRLLSEKSGWSKRWKNSPPMREPFLSFAKAYIRYQHSLIPKQTNVVTIRALAVLEYTLALSNETPNPVRANPNIFNRAARLVVDEYPITTAYTTARELATISKFLIENNLVTNRLSWKSFIKNPYRHKSRISQEFLENREKKLPDQEALLALGQIYRNANAPQHTLPCAAVAILLCAPARISEVVLLPQNCLYRHKDPSSGRQLLKFRWWPVKGAQPQLKDIIPTMAELAEEAVEKIRVVTQPARDIARWYETHPQQIYLPPELEYLRRQRYLNLPEISQIWGQRSLAGITARCHRLNIPINKFKKRIWISFKDIERAAVDALPRGFPIVPNTNLRYRNALFVIRRNELNPEVPTSRCEFSLLDKSFVTSRISDPSVSVFTHYGFKNPDGSDIVLRTHQIRHLLNTIAQKGDLTQVDLALWSGRQHVGQNHAYDHVLADEKLAAIRKAIGDDAHMVGHLSRTPIQLPITREEYARLRAPTALITDTGVCIQDLSKSPCPYHTHCIDCEDHVYQKTSETRERIGAILRESKRLENKALRSMEESQIGANRWLTKHQTTRVRFSKLYSILDDPNIPYGTFISLSTLEDQT